MPRSTSANSAVERLPVNPRRKKVAPDQRKRVATACNNCNVRRVKCSGDHPCRQCTSASRDCQYPRAVEKVSIARPELESLHKRCAMLEKALQEAVPDASRRQELLSRVPGVSTGTVSVANESSESSSKAESATVDEDAPSTEGRLLQDFDGTPRYLGETSGATFLDVLKRFMATAVPLAFNGRAFDSTASSANDGSTFLASVGRYQTFDSRPFFTPSVDPLWLPSRTEMTVMLAELRYFIQDGNGDFPSGGIFYWGDLGAVPADRRSTGGDEAGGTEQYRDLAFYHTAFAFATLLSLTGVGSKQDGQLGEAFFARARMLLGNPLDITMYTSNDIAVLVLMGLYLIENNRRDAAYIYTSTAMHIAIMHGVHRGWSLTEQGKRIFWTVYILDRWLSCLMGRPPSIPEDAIRLDLPVEEEGLPSPIGLRAHVELARISDYIVYNTYRVAAPRHMPDKSLSHAERAVQLLSDWRAKLPPQLQLPEDSFTNDRACYALHMNHNQLLILTIRPIFFLAVKKCVADRFVKREWNIEDHAHILAIRECIDAARRNLRLGRWVRDASPAQKLLHADLHAIFNAAIILMLHQIVFVNLRTNDVSEIAFAIDAFEREAAAGSMFGQDCARVLTDLYALVHGLRAMMFEGPVAGPVQPGPGEQILASLTGGAIGYGIMAMTGTAGAETVRGQGVAGGAAIMGGGPVTISAAQFQGGGGDAVFQELLAWLDESNDLHLYNNFMV